MEVGMTQTIEVTAKQAKVLRQYQRKRERERKYDNKRRSDIRAGLRTVNYRPVTPDEVFNKLLKALPEETLQYITGFLEGDGSVNPSCGRSVVEFSNNDKPLLQYIKDVLQLPNKVVGPPKNGGHQLSIVRQNLTQPLVEALSPYFCCPKTINQVRKTYQECNCDTDFELSEHEPTIPWFVGFWDAEGTKPCPSGSSLILQVCQRDVRPLKKLQKLFNSGATRKDAGNDGHYVIWTGGSSRKLISYILKHSKHQEKQEALKALLCFLAKENYDGIWGKFYQELKGGKRL